MLLRGQRVGLDVLRDEHEELHAGWMNDPVVKAGTQNVGVYVGDDWVARRRAQAAQRDPEAVGFAVVDLSDDAVVGSTSLFSVSWRNRSAVFGIVIGERRGQGLGTEATALTLRWAFEVMSLASLELRVLADNVAGRRAYARAGFSEVGTRRRSILAGGTLVDEIVMDAVAPVIAVLLALGSGAAYGVSNFLGPRLSARDGLVTVLIVSQLAALAGCVLLVALSGDGPPSAARVLLGVLAGAGNAGGLVLFYQSAQLAPISIVAPFQALGAIVPVVYGLATGETLTALESVGLVLAVGGAVLASRRSAVVAETHRDPRRGVLLAAASAVSFGVFLVALPRASEAGRAWALLDARVALILIMATWAGARLASVRPGAARVPLLVVPGLLLLGGTLMYVAATDRGLLSLASVLNSLGPVFTIGLGVAVAGERLSRVQAAGVCSALAGVVLIAA